MKVLVRNITGGGTELIDDVPVYSPPMRVPCRVCGTTSTRRDLCETEAGETILICWHCQVIVEALRLGWQPDGWVMDVAT